MESAITKTKFRSGYVAVTGRPNVGKSTITNALIGAKVAIVSNKPGTTRTRIQGIMHGESSQIVFVDTPGLAIPQGKLGAFMQSEAKAALDGIDALLVVVQAGHIIEIDKHILDRFRSLPIKKVIAVNKTDSVSPEKLAAALSEF
ncbi:MAG: GTPase Era, partial [Oscillospiraceae bacterium]|nr:GTPase Era [Oscillospiraceae bacterium]